MSVTLMSACELRRLLHKHAPSAPDPHIQLLTRLCITINKTRPSMTQESQLREYSVTINTWTRDFRVMLDPPYPVLQMRRNKKDLSDATV